MAAQDPCAIRGLPNELLDEPRLADARGPEQREQVRRALRHHVVEVVAQTLELALATDDRRVEASHQAGRRGVDLEQPIRRDGGALALELELDGLDLHRVPDELLRFLPDQDLAGLRGLLEPRRDVDGVARDERVALAGHDLARVHADPRPQPDRRDGRPQLDRGANRPERVVLVRLRDAEDRHHGVADELLDRAAVPLEDRPRILEVAAHRRPHGLGVEALPERGRARQVAEDDRDGLPDLAGRFGLLERRSAGAAEPEPLWIFLAAACASPHSS